MIFGITEGMWDIMRWIYIINSSIIIVFVAQKIQINNKITEQIGSKNKLLFLQAAVICVIMYGIVDLVRPGIIGWVASVILAGFGLIICTIYFYKRKTDRIDGSSDRYVVVMLIASLIQLGYSYYVLYVLKTYTI